MGEVRKKKVSIPEEPVLSKRLGNPRRVRSGRRAAAVMSLIQPAKLNGHDPYEYLKDVLARLPTQRASEIAELLPHRWAPV